MIRPEIFSSLRSPVRYPGKPGESSRNWVRGIYYLFFHFEYTGGDSPTSWHASYRTEAENNTHPDQVYAYLFQRPEAWTLVQERPPPAEPTRVKTRDAEYIIQYWYFYPFNDWVNNHEGDWEHMNVVLDSQDPELAQIDRVEFYFHHMYVSRSNPGTDFYVSDETHPVIFTGGYGSYQAAGIGGTGTGGHGSYPAPGTWWHAVDIPIRGLDDIADRPNGQGRYIHWSEFQIGVLKDPSVYDFDANPEMSWLKANVRWGQLEEPGSPLLWLLDAALPLTAVFDILQIDGLQDLDDSNNSPPGPRYNKAWGVVSADQQDYELWDRNNPPTVTADGWDLIHVPGDYSTISAAITAADSATTIRINPGTYYESLTMKSGVHLSRNYGTVTLYPFSGFTPVATFSGVNDIKVEGLTLSAALVNAVEITNSTNITLKHCDFVGTSWRPGTAALYVSGASSRVAVDRCFFRNAGYGVNANGGSVVSPAPLTGPIVDTRAGDIHGGSRFLDNIYGIYLTQNANVAVPRNNFSYPAPHNRTKDIYAAADVHLNIDAQGSFWGYVDGTDSLRAPAVQHDGTGRSIVPDRKRVAADSLEAAMKLLLSGQDSEAKEALKYVFETYGDQKEEAIAALYRLVAAASKLNEGSRQKAELMKLASTHVSADVRAAAAYLAIGLLHNEGKVDSALAKMVEFQGEYSHSALLPYMLLDQAILLEHEGEDGKAAALFKELAQTYPTWGQASLVRAKLQARGITVASGKVSASELTAGVGPNPFNPSTTLRLSLPTRGMVSVDIYNVLGQVVRKVLTKQVLEAGHHALLWDGRNEAGRPVASGVYLYRLTFGDQALVGKMTLMR